MAPVLAVRELGAGYFSRTGKLCPAVTGASFDIAPGEILGVLGESGSGKSTIAAAISRLLPKNGFVSKGSIVFEGRDILQMGRDELNGIRGARLANIAQEPATALHPMMRIGDQIGNVLAAHEKLDRKTKKRRGMEILGMVFSTEVERIYRSYPHQVSGGQKQRVLIAQAVACRPSLIVADEPTASLDVTTQHEIACLFREIQKRLHVALLLISHSPAFLANLADRIAVLYAGRIVELGPACEVLQSPQHPYTRALLQCLPVIDESSPAKQKRLLQVIPGETVTFFVTKPGCIFEPRCNDRFNVCTSREPELLPVSTAHDVSCFKFCG